MWHAGALAVHCKAGLGRTGVLICAYLIKHHGFSPEEAIGYIRICRPGSVIGPQQNFLLATAEQLQRDGEAFRAGCNPPQRPQTASAACSGHVVGTPPRKEPHAAGTSALFGASQSCTLKLIC